MDDTDKKVLLILSRIFKVPVSGLNEDSSVDNIKSWDSISHMALIVALEEGFGVEISDKEIGELISFKLIRNIIRGKL